MVLLVPLNEDRLDSKSEMNCLLVQQFLKTIPSLNICHDSVMFDTFLVVFLQRILVYLGGETAPSQQSISLCLIAEYSKHLNSKSRQMLLNQILLIHFFLNLFIFPAKSCLVINCILW